LEELHSVCAEKVEFRGRKLGVVWGEVNEIHL
jgi:hypothetical protein